MIRAAGAIAADTQIVVIGSQSILGALPDAPRSLRVSMEADLYPGNKPELADLIDGSIGEGSRFHEQFGYYAQGVGPETATLPSGWMAIAKYVAGREKDLAFTRELAKHRIVKRATLLERLAATELPLRVRRLVEARIARDHPDTGRASARRKTSPRRR